MIDDGARDLLARPGLLGVVCTRHADGSPRAAPVWFRFDGAAIRIWTDEQRAWVRNLRTESRVAFSVHENERPWRSIVIRGRATLQTGDTDDNMQEIRRISERYLDRDDVDPYIADWPQTRSIVTISPLKAFAAQAFEDPVAHRRGP